MFRNTNLLTKGTLHMAQGFFAGLCVTEYEMNEKATPLQLSQTLEEVRAFLLTFKTKREDLLANVIVSELVDVLAKNATNKRLEGFHFECSDLAVALITVSGAKDEVFTRFARDHGMDEFQTRMFLISTSLCKLNKELNERGVETSFNLEICMRGGKGCAETTN